jgi:adenylate cyclase
MSRLTKGVILGLLTGIAGLIMGYNSFGNDLEENIGLNLLFKLRGIRKAPSEVVIVAIDKSSVENLKLSENIQKWPRSLYAHLIKNLVNGGASVIVFDIIFKETTSPKEDNLFAEEIYKAHNVVLCECIKQDKIPLTGGKELDVVTTVPPIPLFSESAFALAPFPLPKEPVRVSQYWKFKTAAGDKPTLPVAAFQIFAIGAYDDFIRLLKKVSPLQADKLPQKVESISINRGIEKVIRKIHEIIQKEPLISEKMLKELENSTDKKKYQMINSLIKMYQGSNTQYLNFYGPARTIATTPLYEALQLKETSSNKKGNFDVKGKAVFVGLSELSPLEQKEGFYTVFTKEGLDLSGVEIAATAFANFIEDVPIRPLSIPKHIALILLWGIAIGFLCRFFPAHVAAPSVIGLGVTYLFVAEYQFKTSGIWYPLVVPLFFQTLPAFFTAVIWTYVDSRREQQEIRKAFSYYLPEGAVDQILKNIEDVKASDQFVYGVCLSTDAEKYSLLAETLNPKELINFMNKYYETIFNPVKKHGGVISNVLADSMLALWVRANPDLSMPCQACIAALEIDKAVSRFNKFSDNKLPTRIGLHAGYISLGSIGALGHFEYRPVGDIVNGATRVEGLNKHLGTRILITENVIDQKGDFLKRKIGKFLLAGKTKPLVIYELVCNMEECTEEQKKVCKIFEQGLDAFNRQSWEEALVKFHESYKTLKGDGPSSLYIDLCEQYKANPLAAPWDGVIHIEKK